MNNELFEELKKRYPTIHNPPTPDCHRCHGTGERYTEHKPWPYAEEGWYPCLCLFSEHSYLPLISEMIREMIRNERRGDN